MHAKSVRKPWPESIATSVTNDNAETRPRIKSGTHYCYCCIHCYYFVSVLIFLLFLFMLFLLLLLVLFFYMFARMFQAVLPRKAPFRPSQCWTVVSPTRRASSPLREVFRLMTPFSHGKAFGAPRFDHLSRAASPDDRAGLGT